jgi:hypothetical protein
MNFFEKNPRATLVVINLVLLLAIYGLLSLKIFNNAATEYQSKSLKRILLEKHAAFIIDRNVGRFINLREYKPNTVTLLRPSHDYMTHIAPNAIERQYYRLAIDQHGFIAPSQIHDSPDRKIVFLGGSTTECLYVDEEKRFPYVVGRQLESASGLKINTYNGGRSANESLHSLNILINKVLPMKPSMVVMMHNVNDLVALRKQGTYWYQHSQKSHVQTSREVFTHYEFDPNLDQSLPESELIQAYSRNLQLFIAICKIHGIQPVLMTQANRVEQSERLYHHFNDIIRNIAEENHILMIDLAKQIPAEPDMLYDHYHYTAKGSLQAAEYISQKLISSLK